MKERISVVDMANGETVTDDLVKDFILQLRAELDALTKRVDGLEQSAYERSKSGK